MRFISGCSTIGVPTFEPPPWTIFITPGGIPASTSTSTKTVAVAGVSEAGLNTTVLPVVNAGNIFHVGIARGKFHGVIIPAGPTERRITILYLSRNSDGAV